MEFLIGRNPQVAVAPTSGKGLVRKLELDALEASINDLDSKAEKVANKVLEISDSSTDEQYASAKAVYQYGQIIAGYIPEGLAPPIEIDLESNLPDPTTLKIGTFYIIQDMDETAAGHTGKAWVNYTDPDDEETPHIYNKVFDQYYSPDGESVKLNGTGQIAIDGTWLNNKIDIAIDNKSSQYVEVINYNGDNNVFTINHNLDTKNVLVDVWRLDTNRMVLPDIEIIDSNSIELGFAHGLGEDIEFRIVVFGENSALITGILDPHQVKFADGDSLQEKYDNGDITTSTLLATSRNEIEQTITQGIEDTKDYSDSILEQKFTFSTTDLTAGSSTLANGRLYFVYE